jgi:glycosyltransferase involved in cell wall biosynthesis
MHVWIVQTGEPVHCDPGVNRGMRAMNAADALVESGHRVTVWSSDFYHQEKKHRYGKAMRIQISDNLTIQLIPSCGYNKNVSLERFKDHRQLGREFIKAVKGFPLPDVALVGFPPIEIALASTEYLESRGVPVLLDVKDQWPDIFAESVPAITRPVARLVLRTLFKQSQEVMSRATALSSMSNRFLEWAVNRAGRSISDLDLVCPLSGPILEVSEKDTNEAKNWWRKLGVEDTDKLRLLFVGSLSKQFDFKTVLEGIRLASKSGAPVELVVCGTGEMEGELRQLYELEPSIIFAGWIDYPQYKTLAEMSDIALAPYNVTEAFLLSVPNKVIDAFSYSLPILTPLGGEVGELLNNYSAGWVYKAGDSADICRVVSYLSEHRDEIQSYSANVKTVYDKFFGFSAVYKSLVKRLVVLAGNRKSHDHTS